MSLRKSINLKCRQCTYDEMDKGTAAQQIAACTDSDCALHAVRPVTATVLPVRLLDHWGLDPADLCDRAKKIVPESNLSPVEGHFGQILEGNDDREGVGDHGH